MVRLNDDKLLKSTTEGGRLFHIKAVRSVKKMTSDICLAYF